MVSSALQATQATLSHTCKQRKRLLMLGSWSKHPERLSHHQSLPLSQCLKDSIQSHPSNQQIALSNPEEQWCGAVRITQWETCTGLGKLHSALGD
jgi:hypothetical protein